MQLRHESKVHAINAGDHGQRRDHPGEQGEPFACFTLPHGNGAVIGILNLGYQFAQARNKVVELFEASANA